MAKLPAFQFYPGDWLKDPGIRALTAEERGVWFEMLLMMHESEDRGKLLLNGKPVSDDALAVAVGLPRNRIKQILSKLIAYGVAKLEQNTGVIYNQRMFRDNYLRQIRAKSGSKGGTKTQAIRKQKSTPSSSSSSSSSSSLKRDKEGKTPTLDEAKNYFKTKGFDSSEAERFFYHYDARGWCIGKTPIKRWRSAVETWIRQASKYGGLRTQVKDNDSEKLKEWKKKAVPPPRETVEALQKLNENFGTKVIS